MKLKLKTGVLLLLIFCSSGLFAQKGKDGSKTVTAAGAIFNRYIPLRSSAAAGSTTIEIGLPSIMGGGFIGGAANNPYATGALSAGDLLLIIKMQGASINTSNSAAYGTVLDYRGVGDYEFVEVGSLAGSLATTITLANGCSLQNDYAIGGTERVQVIRVPRLASLTINAGASLTAPEWDSPILSGNCGGIVAVEISGATVINGAINLQGKGFRGGKVENYSSTYQSANLFTSTNTSLGAEKGEGIAGNQTDYDAMGGRFGRGAPANGGGGGNAHNCGGGGGSNGDNGVAYNGLGNPQSYAAAWELEATGFSTNVSSGGGRGGYSYGDIDEDATLIGPDNGSWGGEYRKNSGGWGGWPLSSSGNTRVFFGGGGGAGDENDGTSQDAASGGGIVFVLSGGNISGTGVINVNGNDAPPTIANNSDGAGGGGGGGAVVVLSGGSITGISISANGGAGGVQQFPIAEEFEGPGGGGGGGYILTTATGIGTTAGAGDYGYTLSPLLGEFPPNGATRGATGLVVNNSVYPNIVKVDLSLTAAGNSGPFCIGSTKTYTVVLTNNSSFTAANTITVSIPTPSGVNFTANNPSAGNFTAGSWTMATLAIGASQTLAISGTITASTVASFTATVVSANPDCVTGNSAASIASSTVITVPLAISSTQSVICAGSSVTLTASGAANYTWSPGSSTATQVSVSPANTTTYNLLGTIGSCSSTKSLVITVNANPTITIASNPTVICNGQTSTLTAGGGISYTWSPGASTASSVAMSPTSTTVYTLSGKNASGCTDTETLSLSVNPTPTVNSVSNPTVICSGESTTLTASGAASYTWSPGAATTTTLSVNPTVITVYTLTGKNASNCIHTKTLSLTVNANPTVTANSNPTVICNGESATLTASGAASYTWSPGASTASSVAMSPTSTTVYTLSGKNALGCTDTETLSLSVNPTPTVNSVSNPTVICSGESATLTASGAASYTWSPGAATTATLSVNPTVTTMYTLTGKNAANCINAKTLSLTVNANPTVTANSNPTVICSGESAMLMASGATSYTWSPGSATTASLNVSPVSTTLYTLTGKNASGCSNTETLSLNVNTTPTLSIVSSPTVICNGQSATLTASGATSYTWSPGSATTASLNVSPVSTTLYTLTGKNAAGCSNTETLSLTVNATPTLSSVSSPTVICNGQNATLTANGATAYTWSPGSATTTTLLISPTVTTVYTLTGKNAADCSDTKTVALTVNANPTITAGISPTAVCAGESATLTASGAASYTWSPGALNGTPVTVTPSVTTIYTVTGSNAAFCTDTKTVSLLVNPNPTVTVSAGPATVCSGQSATITASGASGYTLNPGALTGSAVAVTPSSTTVYSLTGNNSFGCSTTQNVLLTVNPNPTITAGASPAVICSGETTTLNAVGASVYTWNPGALNGSSLTVNPTAIIIYTVTGVNGSSCVNTQTVSVTVNSNPTVTASANATVICEGNTATLSASGAASYTWNPGAITSNSIMVSPASSVVYTVTGVNSAGCMRAETLGITVNTNPTLSVSSNVAFICEGETATLTAAGATSYTWSPGILTGSQVTVNPAATTVYTVNGANSNGCAVSQTISLGVNPNPTISTLANPVVICEGATAALSASGAINYTWLPGALNGNSVTASPVIGTVYTVTGASSSGCTDTQTISITVHANPVLTITVSPTVICNGQTATLTASGATGYTWNPGALNGNSVAVSPAIITSYTVDGVNSNGCVNSQTVGITVNTNPTVTATVNPAIICAGQTATLIASGALSYTWNPGSLNGSPVSVNPAATNIYTVSGANSSGCIQTQTVSVVVNPNPTLTLVSNPIVICNGGTATLTTSGAAGYTWSPGPVNGSSIIVNPASTTLYTVTGISNPGCVVTETLNLVVSTTPTVNATANPAVICNGQTATLIANGASGYTWQPGGLTGSVVTVTPAANITYTVTGINSAGCTNTQTLSITVNQNPTLTVGTVPTALCSGQSATLSASGASSYTWNPGVLSGSNIVVMPPATTVYTVSGANASGCSDTKTLTLTVYANPTLVVASTPTVVCNGLTATLTVSGAVNYTWQPGALSGGTMQVIPLATTVYTVTGENAPGCVATQTVSVSVSPNPTVSVVLSPAVICSGQSATLTAGGAASYTWSPGILTGSSVAVSPGSTMVYTVTGINNNGCGNTKTVSVVANPTPTVIIATSAASLCSGSAATLTAGGAASYTWSAGQLNAAIVTVTPVTTTVYTVTGKSNTGCISVQTLEITVDATPTVNTLPLVTVCAGTTASLTASGASAYTWQPGSLSGSTIAITPTVATVYTVTAQSGLCEATATVLVNLNSCPGAVNDATVTVQDLPVSGNAALNDLNANGAVFKVAQPLTGTGSMIMDGATGHYTYTPATGFSGTTTVTYTVCNGTPPVCSPAVITIVVYPLIEARADSVITTTNDTLRGNLLINDTGVMTGQTYTVAFNPLAPATGTLAIEPSTGRFVFIPHPVFSGTAITTYTVFYTLANIFLSSSAEVIIQVNPPGTQASAENGLYVPQGFSPNGDGVNDVFVIRGITNYPNNSFTVFNRWGNIVFKANGYNNTDTVWNGRPSKGLTPGDALLPAGTYFCILDPGDGSKPYKGYIILNY